MCLYSSYTPLYFPYIFPYIFLIYSLYIPYIFPYIFLDRFHDEVCAGMQPIVEEQVAEQQVEQEKSPLKQKMEGADMESMVKEVEESFEVLELEATAPGFAAFRCAAQIDFPYIFPI